MVICLLLVQLLLCLIILHKETLRLKFSNFASSIFFLVYTIVYVVEPLILHIFFDGAKSIVAGMMFHFSDEYLYYIFNCYGIALLLTYIWLDKIDFMPSGVTPWVLTKKNIQEKNYSNYFAVMLVIGFWLFVYSTGMNFFDLFAASRFAWFDESSFSLFWLTVSSYFAALAGIYAYYIKINQKNNRWLLFLCLLSIVFQGLMTKDRKWIIFLVSGWLAGYYEVSGRKLVVKKRDALLLVLLFSALVVSQFIRDVMFRYLIGEEVDVLDEVTKWSSFLIEFGDISYFYRASIEALYQNIYNGFTVPLGLIRRTLFFFLPAGYSGGLKVEDISAIFSDVVDGGSVIRRGNMPPGLFGICIISFGWFASLFIIPLLAVLLKKLDSMFRAGQGSFRNVVLSLYTFAVVLSFRGDDSSAVYYMISTLLFIGMVSLFERWRSTMVPSLSSIIRN